MHDQLLVVTDVDNTLYDWTGLWHAAFSTLVNTLAAKTERPAEHWIREVRAVNVRRGAVECPAMLCDLASSANWPVGVDATRVMPAIAGAYRNYWDHHLTTYPGVRAALTDLTEQGHIVVAYTEGDVSVAATRIARLGLSGIIRRVFGRPPLPAAAEPTWCTVNVLRHCPIAVDFIPREDTKPNPTGLRTIIAMCDASPQNTVYIGDSLWKDVVMARTLGAGAIWARYGAVQQSEHVALLERVAHWTPQMVMNERSATLNTVTPDAVIDDPHDLVEALSRRAVSVTSS